MSLLLLYSVICRRATKLLFRDKNRQLFLYNIATQERCSPSAPGGPPVLVLFLTVDLPLFTVIVYFNLATERIWWSCTPPTFSFPTTPWGAVGVWDPTPREGGESVVSKMMWLMC